MSTQENPIWNIISKGEFKENPVHSYERTSYDVSLHLANTFDTIAWQKIERSFKKNQGGNDINSISSSVFSGGVITLLETSSTITTMTDLMIEGYTSPNSQTDTGFSTKFRMSVVQPLGVSLVENIYKAAAVLGIKNHYSHPFFLQVMLKGRKADGEIEVEIPNTRRLYCVYIKNITYNIDVGSANYQIEGIRAGDLNNADDHSLVQKTALTGIETFNDFLNSFQKEINKQERHKLGSTKAILDQFVFRVDSIEDSVLPLEDLTDSMIMPDKASKTNPSNQDLEGGVLAEIERNTSIKEVLERFMSRNEVMQKRITGIREKLSTTNWSAKEIEDLDVEKYIFTITTHNEIISYDSLRRDYARRFVYTITVAPFVSITAAVRKEFDKKKEYTEARVSKMMEKALIKRYDYFNTGMNLDVLNFNINYNYQYVYGLDTMVGLFNKYSEAFNTIINQQVNSSADRIKAVKDGQEANKEFNEAQSDGKLTTGEKYWIKVMQQRNLQNIRNLYDTGAVEPDANSIEAYNALVKDYNEDMKNYEGIEAELKSVGTSLHTDTQIPKLNALDAYTFHPARGWGLPKSKNQKSSKLGSKDILAEAMPDELYENALKEDQGGTQFPVQFYERYVDPSQSGMIEVSTADASGFNTILRNAKVGSAEMVRVTMDIIGDPYWLDHPAYGNVPPTDAKGKPEMADYKRENCVLFCSMIPTEKDADTGYEKALAQRNNQFLTAVYRVWKIEHKFSSGQFTQTLHMVRDAVTDLSLLVSGDVAKRDTEDKHQKINKEAFKITENNNSSKAKKEKEHLPTFVEEKYNSNKWDKIMKDKTLKDLQGTIAAEEIIKGTVDHGFMRDWTNHPAMNPNDADDVEAIVAASEAGVLSKKGIFNTEKMFEMFDENNDGSIMGNEKNKMQEYLQKNEKLNNERDTDDTPDANQEVDSGQGVK